MRCSCGSGGMSASSSFALVGYAAASHSRLEAEACYRETRTEPVSAAAAAPPAAAAAAASHWPQVALERLASVEHVLGPPTSAGQRAGATELGAARRRSQQVPATGARHRSTPATGVHLSATGASTEAMCLHCRVSGGSGGGGSLTSCNGGEVAAAPLGDERAGGKVAFSVSGQCFETLRSTLLRFPDTLLGDPMRRFRFWDESRRTYVFDRHAGAFQSVLYYYQSGGRLYCPDDVPEDVFVEELAFYDLGDAAVRAFERRSGFLTKSVRRRSEPPRQQPSHPSSSTCGDGARSPAPSGGGRGGRLTRPLLLCISAPSASVGGALFAVVSIMLTIVSMAALCIESLPRFREAACTVRPVLLLLDSREAPQLFEKPSNFGETLPPLSTRDAIVATPTELPKQQQEQQQQQQQQQQQRHSSRLPEVAAAGDDYYAVPGPRRELVAAFELAHNYGSPFFIVESCCAAWFTVEAVLRYVAAASVSAGSGRRYFRSAENLFDVCAVVPYYASLALLAATDRCIYATGRSAASSSAAASPGGGGGDEGVDAPLAALRLLRLAGAFRVLKLTRYWAGSRLLGYYLLRSCKECLLFIAFSLIAIASYAVAAYYADEHDTGGRNVRSIPDGMWYALITFWTMGYGDVVPAGPAGKAVGAACMLSGVVSVALLVPVVVANFASFYRRQMARRAYRCSAVRTQ